MTGRFGTWLIVADDSIDDGLCWDFGKCSKTRRLAHVPRLAKPKCEFIDVPIELSGSKRPVFECGTACVSRAVAVEMPTFAELVFFHNYHICLYRILSIHLSLGLPRGIFPPTFIVVISFATLLSSLLQDVSGIVLRYRHLPLSTSARHPPVASVVGPK